MIISQHSTSESQSRTSSLALTAAPPSAYLKNISNSAAHISSTEVVESVSESDVFEWTVLSDSLRSCTQEDETVANLSFYPIFKGHLEAGVWRFLLPLLVGSNGQRLRMGRQISWGVLS